MRLSSLLQPAPLIATLYSTADLFLRHTVSRCAASSSKASPARASSISLSSLSKSRPRLQQSATYARNSFHAVYFRVMISAIHLIHVGILVPWQKSQPRARSNSSCPINGTDRSLVATAVFSCLPLGEGLPYAAASSASPDAIVEFPHRHGRLETCHHGTPTD